MKRLIVMWQRIKLQSNTLYDTGTFWIILINNRYIFKWQLKVSHIIIKAHSVRVIIHLDLIPDLNIYIIPCKLTATVLPVPVIIYSVAQPYYDNFYIVKNKRTNNFWQLTPVSGKRRRRHIQCQSVQPVSFQSRPYIIFPHKDIVLI